MFSSINSLAWRMTLPVPILLVLGLLLLLVVAPRAIEWNIQVTAQENALAFVKDFRSIRDYYNTYVVAEVLGSSDVEVSHRHMGTSGTIPPPATFLKEMNRQRGNEDLSINLYSLLPFDDSNHQDLDRFQQEAWDGLSRAPEDVLVRIEPIKGK